MKEKKVKASVWVTAILYIYLLFSQKYHACHRIELISIHFYLRKELATGCSAMQECVAINMLVVPRPP